MVHGKTGSCPILARVSKEGQKNPSPPSSTANGDLTVGSGGGNGAGVDGPKPAVVTARAAGDAAPATDALPSTLPEVGDEDRPRQARETRAAIEQGIETVAAPVVPVPPSTSPSPLDSLPPSSDPVKRPTDGAGLGSAGLAATLIGTGVAFAHVPPNIVPGHPSNPPPIVPRRRTPSSGTPAPLGNSTLASGTVPKELIRRVTPSGGVIAPEIRATNIVMPKVGAVPPDAMKGGAAKVEGDVAGTGKPLHTIRIPQGGLLGSSSALQAPSNRGLLCEILLDKGYVTREAVDRAIAIQEEKGGQIGRILVSLGACTEEHIARALIQQLRIRKKDVNAEVDTSTAARENKDVAGLRVLTRPGLTVATLLFSDIAALLLAAFIASGVHWARTYSDLGEIDWSSWLVVGPSIALCIVTFLGLDLYSPMARSTPDEIRDITFSTSLVHLGASLLATLGDLPIVKWGIFVRGVWWLATLFLVPVVRSLVRGYFCTQPWWGIPVCVLGAAKTGRLIVRTLKAQPRSGLKPVMLLDDDPAKHGTLRASFTNEVMDVYSVNVSASHFMTESQRSALAEDFFGPDSDLPTGPLSSDYLPSAPSSWHSRAAEKDEFLGPESTARPPSKQKDATLFPRGKFAEVEGVPLVGDLSLAPVLAQRLKIPYAVVAMPGVDGPKLLQIVERVGGKFSHLLVIPDLFGFATLGVPAKNLGGILGVEVRQQLLLPGPRLAKRVMDVALTGIGILFVLPFLLLIALLIKLDSKGPVFYTQKRLGRDGEHFKAYKFRTMHGDGEERLKAILDADPALRAEYEIYHKLKKDPRVTRIGRILRKFSLDEFPQLLNVVIGDMSLVGPRPYIEREVNEMGGQEKIILRAPPGMTGMWQVSDRNATSFAQRVQIDVYYTRNWSPWLDIHILAKTFGVVIKGSGV